MTTDSGLPRNLAAASAAVRAAHQAMREVLAEARAELDEAMREPLLTEDERRQVQELAERGSLGPEMQKVAEQVTDGEADWEQVLRDRDGAFAGPLAAFTDRASREHGPRLERAFAESDPPPGTDDPRRRR
jgi:predicted phage gp36 major capsid-like protein